MGYLSDVRIVTSKKGYEVLDNYVKKYLRDREISRTWNLMKQCNFMKKTENEVCFGWNSLKWYEEYEDVKAVMSGLNNLRKNDYSYNYARIGESYDDFETDCYESNSKGEKDLTYLSVIREFNDDDICEQLEYNSNLKNIEM